MREFISPFNKLKSIFRTQISANSNVRVICPKTGKVLEEITPKDKRYFKHSFSPKRGKSFNKEKIYE